MRPRLRSVPASPDAKHVEIETEEHEHVKFAGCSDAEIEAKLHDFLAWAS